MATVTQDVSATTTATSSAPARKTKAPRDADTEPKSDDTTANGHSVKRIRRLPRRLPKPLQLDRLTAIHAKAAALGIPNGVELPVHEKSPSAVDRKLESIASSLSADVKDAFENSFLLTAIKKHGKEITVPTPVDMETERKQDKCDNSYLLHPDNVEGKIQIVQYHFTQKEFEALADGLGAISDDEEMLRAKHELLLSSVKHCEWTKQQQQQQRQLNETNDNGNDSDDSLADSLADIPEGNQYRLVDKLFYEDTEKFIEQ